MIRHILFDIDNTLYRASDGMDEGITRRMLQFVARYLGTSFEESLARRASGLPKYGTTLEWLKAEHGLTDETAYFDAVHPESELSELKPDPNLRSYLLSLGLPMTVLTNAPMSHALRVLKFYNVDDIFTGIYDITFHGGKGKPHESAFRATLEASGFGVDETLFLDDLPKYARGYKAIGGKAVIVDETGKYADLAKMEGFGHVDTVYGLAAILGNY